MSSWSFSKHIRQIPNKKLYQIMAKYENIIAKNDPEYIQLYVKKYYNLYESVNIKVRESYESLLKDLKLAHENFKILTMSNDFKFHISIPSIIQTPYSIQLDEAERQVNILKAKVADMEEEYPNLKIIKKLPEYSIESVSKLKSVLEERIFLIRKELKFRKENHFSL